MSRRPSESLPPDEQTSRLSTASQMLRDGRPLEAVAVLRVLALMAPGNIDAKRLLGVALNETGDFPGAEAAFRAALALKPNEAALAIGLVEALIAQNKGEDAVKVMGPFVNEQTINYSLLSWAGLALLSAGPPPEAVTMLERATWVKPDSGIARHNLASAYVADRDYTRALTESRKSRELGLDAPEVLMVEARVARGQNRLDDAIESFAEAARQRPGFTAAIVELAETLWVASGDADKALRIYDEAAKILDPARDLARHKAKLQEEIGDRSGAYATLKDALSRLETPELQVFAAQVAVHDDPTAALDHAQRALVLSPHHSAARAALAQIYLALGEPRLTANIADGFTRRSPEDQYGWALLATAWRMVGDPRYERLHDYARMVVKSPIDTPRGWSSLDAYLADLADELRPLHGARGHQIGQSMRRGSQTESDLARETSPAIAAFFGAIDGPIRRYMTGLGKGRDPLRGRMKSNYALNGIWSVKLGAGGYHVDHVHPKGWISSACHIELPSSVSTEPEGWLKFGEPGIPTSPMLEADYRVKPAPGQLVLFPSYMWHGTVPFSGSASRLSVAFDAVPV